MCMYDDARSHLDCCDCRFELTCSDSWNYPRHLDKIEKKLYKISNNCLISNSPKLIDCLHAINDIDKPELHSNYYFAKINITNDEIINKINLNFPEIENCHIAFPSL